MTVTSLRDTTATMTTGGVCLDHLQPRQDRQGRTLQQSPSDPSQNYILPRAPADEGRQQAPCTPPGHLTPGGTLPTNLSPGGTLPLDLSPGGTLPLNPSPGGPAEPTLHPGATTATTTRPRSTSGRPPSASMTSLGQGAGRAAPPAPACRAGRGQPGPAGPPPPPPGPRTASSRS